MFGFITNFLGFWVSGFLGLDSHDAFGYWKKINVNSNRYPEKNLNPNNQLMLFT